MTLDDLPAVIEIDQLSFPNPWPKNSYRYEILENENSVCWVAGLEHFGAEKIIAMAVIWIILDEIHIGTIAIHPDFRNQGFGTIFLGKILSEAAKAGLERALLEVRRSNQAALNLYKKFGFEVDGIRKKYYQDNREDAILMSAPLAKKLISDSVSNVTNNGKEGEAL